MKKKTPGYWTKEKVMEIARLCSTKKEFRSKETAYYYARKFKMLDELTWLKKGIKGLMWTDERIIAEAQKYNSLTDFTKANPSAYNRARKTRLLKKLAWLQKQNVPVGYWTDDKIIEISHRFTFKHEFEVSFPYAYKEAGKRGLLKKMSWLQNRQMKELSDLPIYLIYAYEDDELKVAYIGLTRRTLRRRDYEHRRPKLGRKDCLLSFYDSIRKKIPTPIILEDGLYPIEAQIKEEYYSGIYTEKGYKLLNNPKLTGIGKSSLGYYKDWTPDKVMEEAKKYKTKSEFKFGSPSAYKAAISYQFLNKMPWMNHKKRPEKWSKQIVLEIAKQYDNLWLFRREQTGAYNKAKSTGWLPDMYWLNRTKPDKTKKWTKEEVIKEGKKYSTRIDFKNGCSSAYSKACKNGWINEMCWLKRTTFQLGYWTKENVFKHSHKCKSRTEFSKRFPTAYGKAMKNGWIVEMPWLTVKEIKTAGYWDIRENVIEEAKKYNSRTEFAKKSDYAYKKALKNGWIDELFR